jgi:hypothetical protein
MFVGGPIGRQLVQGFPGEGPRITQWKKVTIIIYTIKRNSSCWMRRAQAEIRTIQCESNHPVEKHIKSITNKNGDILKYYVRRKSTRRIYTHIYLDT